jgi:Helicase HerA, central domain
MDGPGVINEEEIGRIVAITGSRTLMLLNKRVTSEGQREQRRPLQLGTLVKVSVAGTSVFGIVTSLKIPLPLPDGAREKQEFAEFELVGEIIPKSDQLRPRFQRGVSIFPGLDERVLAATQEDLALVYAAPDRAAVRIGTIHQDRSLPAYVITDELLGKHFAVLGTTGTGKSCAVALVLRNVLAKHKNGHVVLLDMHNEYARAFGDCAEVLTPKTFELPYWLLTFEEFEEIALGPSRDRQVEANILAETILAAKRLYVGTKQDRSLVTVDMPFPYRWSDIDQILDQAAGSLGTGQNPSSYLSVKARLKALRSDPRFGFLFPVLSGRDNMEQVLSQLFRIPVSGKPMTIVDLSSIPSEVLNVVVSVLCRLTFDFALWSERSVPIMLVCEEAHRCCPRDSRVDFEPARRALSRIAKEGRKYGISLCLVSQRPSEIASAVLSQCNTVFALRLSNNADQEFVRGVLRESGIGLLDFLPSLRNAEAIAIGEGVPIPVRMCFDDLAEENRPLSGSAKFSVAWDTDVRDRNFLPFVVERWRQQRP